MTLAQAITFFGQLVLFFSVGYIAGQIFVAVVSRGGKK